MKILHTADWHLGKNLEGCSRLQEQEEFLGDFVRMVEEHNVDLVVIAGDIYDTSNPPAKAEKLFYDTLKKISNNGERITLVIAGNHDNPERIMAAGPLAMEHGIIMVGTPKTVISPGQYGNHRVLDSGEGFLEVEIHGEKAIILAVPYPSEKRLEEVLYGDMEAEKERLKTYSERIQLLFEGLKDKFREDTINLVVSHLFAMGCEEGGSERSIQLGGSFILDGSVFPKEAQYVALGHVHKPQVVPGTDHKVRYAGSPLHYNKKEINFKKGCYLVEVKAKEVCTITQIPIPVYKPIEIWKCENYQEALTLCEKNKDRSCWVYLEIKTEEFIKEHEIKQLKDLKDDILEITPILKGVTTQEEEIGPKEKSFEELFVEFYKKELDVNPTEEILQLLGKIIQEGEEDETN